MKGANLAKDATSALSAVEGLLKMSDCSLLPQEESLRPQDGTIKGSKGLLRPKERLFNPSKN